MPALRTRAPTVRVATLAAVGGQAHGADEGALDHNEPSVAQAAHRLAARRARAPLVLDVRRRLKRAPATTEPACARSQ
jgi:hypothetical protein